MMELEKTALSFPPVQIFCGSVTENSGAQALSQGCCYRPRYYRSLAAWPTSLATDLISRTALSLLFGFSLCTQILTVPLGLLYLVLSFLIPQLCPASCLCSVKSAMSHWVSPTLIRSWLPLACTRTMLPGTMTSRVGNEGELSLFQLPTAERKGEL